MPGTRRPPHSEPLCKREGSISQASLASLLAKCPKDAHGYAQLRAIDFSGASFSGDAIFEKVCFAGCASFEKVRFCGDARFEKVRFSGDIRFDKARFSSAVTFNCTTFAGDATFNGATFDGPAVLGPMIAAGTVALNDAAFQERLKVAVRAASLLAQGADFSSGADIVAVSASMAFDRTVFAEPSTVGSARRGDADFGPLTDCAPPETPPIQSPEIARIQSLQGARITALALSLVDLRSCRFLQAQGLEGLHLEQAFFQGLPRGIRRGKCAIPVRYARRRWAIAEEVCWREAHQRVIWPRPDLGTGGSEDVDAARRSSKTDGEHAPQTDSECCASSRTTGDDRQGHAGRATARDAPHPDRAQPDSPTPHQITAIYRALRTGREGRRDEPGAADFYYGEMEMRRHAVADVQDDSKPLTLNPPKPYDSTRPTPRAERTVLFLYWLTSGYGLRAARAVGALLVTLACGAFVLWKLGQQGNSPVLLAVESGISPLYDPELKPGTHLDTASEVVIIALRLLGPLFLGFALLSLRGRITR